jgi:hypothetical protein
MRRAKVSDFLDSQRIISQRHTRKYLSYVFWEARMFDGFYTKVKESFCPETTERYTKPLV